MLQKLFEPIRIGKMDLKNRIVYASTSTNLSAPDGSVTERLADYLMERAKGGVGLMILEPMLIAPGGAYGVQLAIHNPRYLPSLRRLVESIKEYDVRVAAEVAHAGRCANPEINNTNPVAPSAIPCPVCKYAPVRELTIEEIQDLVKAYGEAAARCKLAGFDAVEILCGNYELIPQFLSAHSNKRNDLYGNDFEGRIRFALEVVGSIRARAGVNFPIICKINAAIENCKKLAKRLEDAGVNAFEVTLGSHDSISDSYMLTPPMYYPRGYAVSLAKEIKAVVDVPIIAAGRINDPDLAEKILEEGKADLVSLCRALIADPEFPKKAAEGRVEDIRKCIACNTCLGRFFFSGELKCAVNAEVGREEQYRLRRADKPKRVLVVGGGPGGMEAARVAALRGHDVVLCERESKLGGQLTVVSLMSFKAELRNLTDYLSAQIKKLGVKIVLNKEVDPKAIKDINPDVVIVATGASPVAPKIRGIETGIAVQALDILKGKATIGEKVIVVGGGSIGCEIAAFLAEQRKKVTITTRRATLDELASNLDPISRGVLIQKLADNDVKILLNMKIDEITDKGLILIDIRNMRKRNVEADTVVLASGLAPNKELAEALKGKVPELYTIGDCVEPRRIFDAIHEAAHIARII